MASNKPLVSVCIQTYQHEAFIGRAIDSVLAQKVDFSYEIIIGEDESSDTTRDICIAYEKKYPGIIRLFLRSEKDKIFIDGRKTGRFNFISNLDEARGEFIALLDGDDYWVDEDKLQTQVAALKANPQCNLCFTPVYIQKRGQRSVFLRQEFVGKETIYAAADLAAGNFVFTCTALFRNNFTHAWPAWTWEVPMIDYPLFVYLSTMGDLLYLPRPSAFYNQHEGGMWTSQNQDGQLATNITMLDRILPYYEGEVRSRLLAQRRMLYTRRLKHAMIRNDNRQVSELIKQVEKTGAGEDLDHTRSFIKRNYLRYRLKSLLSVFLRPLGMKLR